MVEVARVLAAHRDRLRRGLRVAFWSGHSHGRYSGSAWYADNHWRELRERCVAHVNIDSVGGRGATVLSEGIAMASTRGLGAEAIRAVAGEGFEGGPVGRAGDQSFVSLGIPSLWMSLSEQPPSSDPMAAAFASVVGSPRSGGLGWWWHTVEDTMDKLDPDLMLRDARIYVHALGHLLWEPLLPLAVAAQATEVLAAAEVLARAASGYLDLGPVVRAAREASEAAAALEAWRAKQGDSEVPGDRAVVFDRGVTGLLGGLVGTLYSRSGPFGQDPTAAVPPLPLLDAVRRLAALPPDDDQARALTVDLVRARNRVEDALVRGVDAARSALERLA
jgi:hypothetical protein